MTTEDSDHDDDYVVEESPCGRWHRRRQTVSYRFDIFSNIYMISRAFELEFLQLIATIQIDTLKFQKF